MDKENTIRKEMEEVQRQLRSAELDVTRMAKEIPILEERLRIAEQKNIDDQTKLGIDPINVQPSKEVRRETSTLATAQKSLEMAVSRRDGARERIEALETELLEGELIQSSRLQTQLESRAVELEEKLKELRHEIDLIAKKKEALAIKIAKRTKDASDSAT